MCSAVGYCTTITDLSFPDATSMADGSLCSGMGCDALTSLEIPLITTIPSYFFASTASPHLLTSIDISSLTAMPDNFCNQCIYLTTFYTKDLTLGTPLLTTVINGDFTINDLISF